MRIRKLLFFLQLHLLSIPQTHLRVFRDRPNRPLSHLSDKHILGWDWMGLAKLLKELL